MTLIEQFAAKLLHPLERKYIPEPLGPIAALHVAHTVVEEPDYTYKHDIGVEWKARVFIKRDVDSVDDALKNVVRSFNAAAYGHLQRRLMALDMAILEHDYEKARMHIRDLYRDMNSPV